MADEPSDNRKHGSRRYPVAIAYRRAQARPPTTGVEY